MRFSIAAAGLVVLGSLAGCDGGDSEQDDTPTPGAALQVLIIVGDGLPRFPNLVVDQEYIYTGGDVTDSIYWSGDPVDYMKHFYWEKLPPAGWNATGGWTAVPADSKDAATSWLVAERGGFRAEFTVAEGVEKDSELGTTRLGIRIKRLDPSATAPPVLPSPMPVESGI